MVAGLSDEALRSLLGRLLESEARAHRLPLSGIDLGGNQTAADGGVDASIKWMSDPQVTAWLPRRHTIFQCKAETMSASAVMAEMRPKDVARPLFSELAKASAAYIIFSTDDPSKAAYDRRLAAMAEAISDVAGSDRISLDFYGADRIARWANQYPGAALWVLERSGRALGGWRPYGFWSARESAEAPYLIDEAARASIAGQESDVRDAITAMRAALSSGGGSVRLVGLSGMGKTRLAEALFDGRVLAEAALPSSLAIYADAGLELATGAALVAEQLVLSGVEAVLVVDNCTARTHAQLSEIVKRKDSRVRLLTIDYDVGDEQPGDTLLIRLGANSEGVVRALLKQRVPRLQEAEIDHLARFSEGNARVALAIARGAGKGLDLSSLSDAELVDRLFQTGRSSDLDTRRAADAAALVYAFHADPSDTPVEHPVLAGIAGMPVDAFYRQVETMLAWGIAQQRGPQRALKPDPIANQLAASMLKLSDPEALLKAFADGPERLFASFARRLGQLDRHPKAQAVARRLLSDGEWLGDLRGQTTHQRRAFHRIAPAAPEPALSAVERILASADPSPITGSNEDRQEFGRLLAHLAYDETLFVRAVKALVRLALAEQSAGSASSAQDYLLQRFWPGLAWTQARTARRLEAVDMLLDDDDAAVRTLGIEALDHMLDAWHLSSSFDPAFGSQLRDREWRPSGADYRDWIEGAYHRLGAAAGSTEPYSSRARQVVAQHLREHLHTGLGTRAIAAMRAVRPSGYWDDGWRKATETLHFCRGKCAAADVAALAELETELRPCTLDACFEAFVLGEPWRHWRPGGGENASMRNIQLLAKAVGVRLARSGAPLQPYLERALSCSGPSGVAAFGEGLGRAGRDLAEIWRDAYQGYARLPETERSAGVLIGLTAAAENRDPTWADARLTEAVADPLLQDFIVHLHSGRTLGASDVERFIQALDRGFTPERLNALMYGGATEPIPAEALARLLGRMLDHPDGAVPALEVLSMRIHGDRQAKREVAPELVDIARKLLVDRRCYAADRDRADHEMARLARLVFRTEQGAATAVGICRALRSLRRDYWSGSDFDELARVLMKSHPRIVLDEIVATAKTLLRRDLASVFFGGALADIDDHSGRAALDLDEDVLLAWAAEAPQARAVQLAGLVPYAETLEGGGALGWSSAALALIKVAPDPVPLLSAFESRFFEGVSSGPFSSRYGRRLPMVTGLKTHADRRIRNWARDAEERLHRSIEQWDKIDRDHDSRFE